MMYMRTDVYDNDLKEIFENDIVAIDYERAMTEGYLDYRTKHQLERHKAHLNKLRVQFGHGLFYLVVTDQEPVYNGTWVCDLYPFSFYPQLLQIVYRYESVPNEMDYIWHDDK